MKTKRFKTSRARAELIASYPFAAPPPPPAPSGEAADAAVTQAIAAIKSAVDAAAAAQAKDPDGDSPEDAKVAADLAELAKLVDTLTADQKADSDASAPTADPSKAAIPPPTAPEGTQPTNASGEMARRFAGAPPASSPVAAPPAAGETPTDGSTPPPMPVDENGNVSNDVLCDNDSCGHPASVHQDTDEGDNTGACTSPGCTCPQMQIEDGGPSDEDEEPTADDGDAVGQGPDDESMAARFAPGDVVPAPAVNPSPAVAAPGANAPSTANAPPLMAPDPSIALGPAFTIPVAIIEGQDTGDGRSIAPMALTWRVPPLPLMGLDTETHDPEGWDLNDPAVICGRIDSFTRTPGEDGTQIISAAGFFLSTEEGLHFAQLCEQMGRLGVSADVAIDAAEITITDVDDDGWPMDFADQVTAGAIMGLTVCPYPAFEGAYIVLGDGTAQPSAIPATNEPVAPSAVAASARPKIHFMTYRECEPCNQGLDVIVASAAPTKPPAAWFADPAFTIGDGRLLEILDRRGKRALGGKWACPLTITDEGRVFGHMAPWKICHTGIAGECVMAQPSAVGYAHFMRGQTVETAEGKFVRVGALTVDTGHASTRPGVAASSAMAHYDNTGTVVADVTMGHDEFGIWVAGAIRPDATEAQVRKLRASSLSGDWRRIGGQLEVVAALAVNTPGFPIAVVADGSPESLVAAGAITVHRLAHPIVHERSAEDRLNALERALQPQLSAAARSARERLRSALS